MPKDSEFRAYEYIQEVLKELGWDTRNPSRGGEVYTQDEFYKHDSLLTDALGKKRPENIIRIPWKDGHRYWVVEAKAEHEICPKHSKKHKNMQIKSMAKRLQKGWLVLRLE